MNHYMTFKSLAPLHYLCVMTTSGMAGRGLREHGVCVCVCSCAYLPVSVCWGICQTTTVQLRQTVVRMGGGGGGGG